MSKRDEKGFSLIELLLVVVVIGIIAAVAVPAFRKALTVAENGNVYSVMRTISSSQVNYYSQNSRFARLNEINNAHSGALGTISGTDLNRGKFVLSMVPANPTPAELQQGYTINAVRNLSGEDTIYHYTVTQSGEIVQVLP
jgi:prepilin-type N-terminal cleavage/methylation domain-containing protein